MSLTPEQRATFWALADVLIPATDAMPAASEAGSVEKWLDRALEARPDLVEPLAAVLDAAAGRDPEGEARRLHAEDPDGFSALAQIASGGYYMNLKVRKRIGYPGQGKRPPFSDEAEYDLRDGLLDPVYARGPINTTAPPPPETIEPATPLSFSVSGNGAKADVLIVGAGRRRLGGGAPPGRGRASRSSAWSRAAGRTPPTSPATSSSGSSSRTRSGARTRTRGSTRPTIPSRSRARPSPR